MLIAPAAFLLSWLFGPLSYVLLVGGPALLWAWAPGVVVGAGYLAWGMAALALCRRFRERLGPRVAGLVLANTTDRDPARSTTAAGLFTAHQRPRLAPLVWLSAWLGYANGTAHLLAWMTGIAGGAGGGCAPDGAPTRAADRPAEGRRP